MMPAFLKPYYRKERKYLKGNDLSQCPLCEHDPIDQDKILEQITIRLDKLKTLPSAEKILCFVRNH